MNTIYTWLCRLYQRCNRQRRFSNRFIMNFFTVVVVYVFLHLNLTAYFLLPTIEQDNNPVHVPFDHLLPSDRFDLFWIMWNTDQSTFRARRLLVLESLFIHHPKATVLMFSSTLNDTQLFLPFRQRGYHIYSFNISLQHMIQWKWYLNQQTKQFLHHWNTSSPYFYSHISDYLRTIVLYLYGGTYMDMDALILQPLPYQEFIGFDRTDAGDKCLLCVKNTSGQYLAPGFMRFRSHRTVFREILQQTFDTQVYDENCFNCVGPKPFTKYIIQYRNLNDSELTDLVLLEFHRLYPFMWAETSSIFHDVEEDTTLQLADLMKRSYSLHLFGHMSDRLSIAQGSLIDLLFDRYDLGDLRPRILNRHNLNTGIRLVCPSLYIYTSRKQGRFIGRDVIYLRLNHTFHHQHIRWNITIHISNGHIIYPQQTSQTNLNQAQINLLLNTISYKPSPSTKIDTLLINVRSENVSVTCSLSILIFSQWVSVLTKTMGTSDRWPVVQKLVASVERYFPQTTIHVASDSGKEINKNDLLNFTSSDNIKGDDLLKSLFIHNLPEDSGLSICRNYLLNLTTTPFFFILDDDFVFEEDSHLDLLLEIMYTHEHIDIIAGKIPEDIQNFHDYAGTYLRYNQTLELVHDVPDSQKDEVLFRRSRKAKLARGNPCRQVDFVPNVFLGRKESVGAVGWDNSLKLGEHEDFFVRFGQANRTVYTCEYIQVHHRQIAWWKTVDNLYYQKRGRVYGYYKNMLKKHNLKRIITFGVTNLDLDKLPES